MLPEHRLPHLLYRRLDPGAGDTIDLGIFQNADFGVLVDRMLLLIRLSGGLCRLGRCGFRVRQSL